MRLGYSQRPTAASPAALNAMLLFLAATLPVLSSSSPDKAAAFMKCFDESACLSRRTAWEHFSSDLPSCLTAARVWWSERARGVPVTLVTQLSAERLDQLQAQCATWDGPLAAALYLPLLNPRTDRLADTSRAKLNDTIAGADALFRAAESRGRGCQLRLVLLYELFADERALLLLYPVNSLRNYARLLADTDLMTNIDVDMIPSVSISETLAQPAALETYTSGCRTGAVYVWPAFETHCGGGAYADNIAVAGKVRLAEAMRKCLRRMRPKAPFSHNATDYERWLAGNELYEIAYGPLYEPWFMSWRWRTTWFDYRYRGYGKNKIVQAAAMNASGATWFVSPHGYLVHRPHSESRARRDFLRAKFSRRDMADLRGSLYEHVETLWGGTQQELQAGNYSARLEADFQACLGSLSWWKQAGGR